VPGSAFEWICEIEPPTKPDMMHVRHQIGVLSNVASGYLIPDNHVGRATVSSIAVAHEVDRMGGRSIACLNARDRNALGFRRDLLTGAAYGVDEFLFVYGDAPVSGARTGQLTVRSMIEYLRQFSEEYQGRAGGFRAGVTTRLTSLPSWKRAADFLFVQVSFDLQQLLAWRDTVEFGGNVYAGVMVLPSASMARKLVADIPEITVPRRWTDAIDRDQNAGVYLACELAHEIAESGAFDGVHFIPGVRYREAAAHLEK
jgi:methylenetetrahydrofolate reductase (NADPH)